MAPKKLLSILMKKNDGHIPWGFSVVGGTEIGLPVIIDQVHPGTLANQHLQAGDIILKIENIECSALSIRDIEDLIHGTSTTLDLLVWKNPEDMVKLIKKQDNIFQSQIEIQNEEFHDKMTESEQQSSDKFNFKYPHQFLDPNKFLSPQQPQLQRNHKNCLNSRKTTLEEIKKKVIEETAEAFNDRKCVDNASRFSSQILKDNGRLYQNGIRSSKTEHKEQTINNVVYNNVNNIRNAGKPNNQGDSEKVNRAQNVECSSTSKKSINIESKVVDKTADKYLEINGRSIAHPVNVTYTKAQSSNFEESFRRQTKEGHGKDNDPEFEFKPLANSTLLRRPSDREFQNKKCDTKKEKEDEDDIDAQFSKYYQNMIESKQEKQKTEKSEPVKSVITKELPPVAKSSASLFNRNYQSKLEERKRTSKSSERMIKEAQREINQLIKRDFANAEWSGKTEIYESHKASQNTEQKDAKDIDEDEDEDEPYNELKKNPMFNRLRTIEAQIERCMTPERLERENEFNKKFEEYYRSTSSKSNFMNTRWNASGKRHSEENLSTLSKPHIPRPSERLTDPRGVFFKKRYEECVTNSRTNLQEKQSVGFKSSGFNNSRKFWKEMEKNCPGNSSEYRTHFVKLQSQSKEKQNVDSKKENKTVETDHIRKDIKPQLQEVHEPPVIRKHIDYDDHNEKPNEPETKCLSPYDNLLENCTIRKDTKPQPTLQEVNEPPVIRKHIDNRPKTPVGFYENIKPKLKVEIPNKAYEKIQTFALTKNEERKLRSPVAENIEKIIASRSNSRQSSRNNTPPNEQLDEKNGTFRTITPNVAASNADASETRSSRGFTPTSPFYYENLKASPVFMGLKVKVAENGDCKRCSICGEEPDYEEFGEEIGVKYQDEGAAESTGCCGRRSNNE
ncbi:hypothetical protein M8J76_001461 [Diaphorina citri]|nr:hypothetical protein M8J75_008451 [Diaphorina citri]KAI5732539.1 hypothetical protein M8J76_001461 [Diaphorina citri]